MVLLDQDEILETLSLETNGETILVDSDQMQDMVETGKILFNLLHLNIRSVSKNIDSLLLLLESFQLDFNVIIVLSETFKHSSTDYCNIPT